LRKVLRNQGFFAFGGKEKDLGERSFEIADDY